MEIIVDFSSMGEVTVLRRALRTLVIEDNDPPGGLDAAFAGESLLVPP